MKYSLKVFLLLSILFQLYSCNKDESNEPAKGKIVFWLSKNNGCGPLNVSIDGANVGQITGWQVIPPTTCNASNLLLVVSTTQGNKRVTFKNNCGTATVNINLNTDCYIYNVY